MNKEDERKCSVEIRVGRLLLSHPSLSQTREVISWPRSLPLAYSLV